MRTLYQARDSLEARLLLDALRAADIGAVILGEHLAGAAGELPAFNFPTVWIVENAQWGRAQAVLDAFLDDRQGPAATRPAWVCARCAAEVDGELDLCWNCGSGRPA